MKKEKTIPVLKPKPKEDKRVSFSLGMFKLVNGEIVPLKEKPR